MSRSGARLGLLVAVLIAAALLRSREPDSTGEELPNPPAAEAPKVSLYDGRAKVDPRDLPAMGSPRATERVYALIDPIAPESAPFEQVLDALVSGFGGKLSIALVPGVNGAESEAVHRSLLALWHCDPTAYMALRGELAVGTLERSRTQVERRARELIGSDTLRDSYVLNAQAIESAVEFGKRLRFGNRGVAGDLPLPQLLVGEQVLPAGQLDPQHYARAITEQLGLEPVAPVTLRRAALEFQGGGLLELGGLAAGATRFIEFKIRNRGTEDLDIHWLKLAPGCAVDRLPRAPIAAGQGGVIRMRVDVPASPGRFERRLVVNHSGIGGQARLTVAGTAIEVGSAPPNDTPAWLSAASAPFESGQADN